MGHQRSMPRQASIQFPGAVYDALARGDRREAIFRDDDDCRMFPVSLDRIAVRLDMGARRMMRRESGTLAKVLRKDAKLKRSRDRIIAAQE